MEGDVEAMVLGGWVGLYRDEEEDLVFVAKYAIEFAPNGKQQFHIGFPLKVKCYRVGTHSRCLREWVQLNGNYYGHFHHVMVIYIARGHGKEEKEEITFIYEKEA